MALMKTKLMLAISLVINVLLVAFIWRHPSPSAHIASALPVELLVADWPSPWIKPWVPIEVEFNAIIKTDSTNDQAPLPVSTLDSPEAEFVPSNKDRGLYITPIDAGI